MVCSIVDLKDLNLKVLRKDNLEGGGKERVNREDNETSREGDESEEKGNGGGLKGLKDFKEQGQIIYASLLNKIDSLFLSKPTLFTFLVAGLISFVVFLFLSNLNVGEGKTMNLEVAADFSGGENKVQENKVSENVNGFKGVKEENSLEKEIVVDLSGAINKPGLYTLKAGSRLGDLLSLGGGFASEASLLWVSKNVNLATKLKDGDKIYIPFDWDLVHFEDKPKVKALNLGVIPKEEQEKALAGALSLVIKGSAGSISGGSNKDNKESINGEIVKESSKSGGEDQVGEEPSNPNGSVNGAVDSSLINVNTASLSQLDTLPGVGTAYGNRIIDNRPYKDFDEFKQKSKIPQSLAEKLKGLITF